MNNKKTNLNEKEVKYIETEIGYEFKNKQLLRQAFTMKSIDTRIKVASNEILIQIGDALIRSLVMKYFTESMNFQVKNNVELNLFKNYNEVSELLLKCGYMNIQKFIEEYYFDTYLNDYNFQLVMKKRNLEVLLINRSNFDNNDDISNLFKAIIGAITVDSEWNYELIDQIFFNIMNNQTIMKTLNRKADFNSIVNKWYYKKYNDVPEYKFINENEQFTCSITLNNCGKQMNFSGNGISKDISKKNCCENIVKYLVENNELESKSLLAFYLNVLTDQNAIFIMNDLVNLGLIPNPSYNLCKLGEKELWECEINLGFKLPELDQKYQFCKQQDISENEAKLKTCFFTLAQISQLVDEEIDFEVVVCE